MRKRTKRKKEKLLINYNKLSAFLLFVATLFMAIGYASISEITLDISGEAIAKTQEGVFITEVNYSNSVNADTTSSKINYFLGTMLDSQVVLGTTSTSSMTYNVKLYNNTDKEYLFIGVVTDKEDKTLYSNKNIKYSINGLNEYITIISPKSSLEFTITFEYKAEADTSENILTSKLNFKFRENPKLVLSNEDLIYTLNDIYPNYTPQEYTFTVSNYSQEHINSIPMTYSFETSINSPLSVKIYDEDGNEVTGNITIDGDGEQLIDYTYTLKVIWDDSNPESGVNYNSYEYANKTFNCNVVLKYSPGSVKNESNLSTKEFGANITSAPFTFELEADQSINIEKDGSPLSVSVSNYNSSTEYNKFNTNYEISILNNSKFSYSINGESPTNGVIKMTLSGTQNETNSYDIILSADIDDLSTTESATLNIVVKSPYYREMTLPINLSLQKVTVTLNANGGIVSPSTLTVYKGKNYTGLPTPTWAGHTFNGWYTATTGGTKVTSSTEVTTSSNQTLYAQWTSRLLVDNVSLGDYVNYPVNYSNVATKKDGTLAAADTGWRVVGFGTSNGTKYVKLISAGVPLTYRHAALDTSSGTTSVTNLTTGFFNTAISTSSANYTFNSCGFKTSSGSTVTTISQLKTLFTNDYTQITSNVPKVQSVVKEDLTALGLTVADVTPLTNSSLFGIKAATPTTSYSYAGYYLGSKYDVNGTYMWAVYQSGYIVYTYGLNGVRPVVHLNATVETTGQVNGVWQLS